MMERLKFKLPEPADGDLPIDTIPVVISAIDAAISMAELITGSAVLGVVGFPVSIGAAFFGNFLALGSGYAEARENIRADRLASGYSKGLVMACDNRPASLVARYFWEHNAEHGYGFVDGGKVAQNAFNQGLVTGYWNGFECTRRQKKLIWGDLLKRTNRAGTLDPEAVKQWSGRAWMNWYIDMGAAFRRYHMS